VYAVGDDVQTGVLATSGITTSVGEWRGSIDLSCLADVASTPGIVVGVTRKRIGPHRAAQQVADRAHSERPLLLAARRAAQRSVYRPTTIDQEV
jgi:hypothetical protein